MYPPGPLPSISDMAIDRPTLLNSPHPHRTTQTTTTTAAATTTCNAQPKSPTAIEAQICNYFQSCMPTTTTLRLATPCTAVALRGSGHETTTTTDQSTAPAAPPSVPRVMRATWTTQMVTQLVQLRSQGLSWSRISTHFPRKTGNACRKRYERHRKISAVEGSDGRDVIATSAELMAANFPRVSGHETTAPRAFTS